MTGTEGAKAKSEKPLFNTRPAATMLKFAEALILGGADIEVMGGSIDGGTALGNAIGHGQLARGATAPQSRRKV